MNRTKIATTWSGGCSNSSSLRVSWNPTANWSFQASWADISSPEALEPDEDEERWSVSGIYTRPLRDAGWWSATFAFANKERTDGVSLDAWMVEAAWHPNDNWTVLAAAKPWKPTNWGPRITAR